ncbi:MAG: hypothetical protein HUJ30_01675 [Gammaproteobacteria bacterium]|nr:hypothetical protein [Gammaproteobacteria bacterium]
MATNAWGKTPSIEGLDAIAWLDDSSGTLLLSSHNMKVYMPHMFRSEWPIKELNSLVQWKQHQGSWYVSSDRININGADVDMDIAMDLVLAGESNSYLDLIAKFENANLQNLDRYQPYPIMSDTLLKWFDMAFVRGQGNRGNIVYRGWLKKREYPFRQRQGKFEVEFQADNMELAYHAKWPSLKNTHGDLYTDGLGLKTTIRSANTVMIPVNDLDLKIKDYRKPVIELEGKASGNTMQVMRYIESSPLKEPFSAIVGKVQASGKTDVALSLSVPLGKVKGHVKYDGSLYFQRSQFESRLGKGRLQANNVNGRVFFNENTYRSSDLSGEMFGRPIDFELVTRKETRTKLVELYSRGESISAAQMHRELQFSPLAYLDGKTDIDAVLRLSQGNKKETKLLIDTRMKGMAIDLPSPLGKSRSSSSNVSLEYNLKTDVIHIAKNRVGRAVLKLDNKGDGVAIERGEIHVGNEIPQLPNTSALILSGKLQNFPLADWFKVLTRDKTEGVVVANTQYIARLEYLQIEPKDEPKQEEQKKPKREMNLPPFSIDIDSLQYGDLLLGRARFKSLSKGDGEYQFERISLTGPIMNLYGSGIWNQRGKHQTSLNLNLQAPNVETLLTRLDFDTPIRGGELKLNGTISWPGAPNQFSMDELLGELKFNINNGRLDNIEPGAGRVLGLFSFQALPRRLALDFRDLFGKGYRFDSANAVISLADGNAYTKKMEINSPSARISMSGRTGLVAKDYDHDVIIIPGDGSNYFVAGFLAGGLQTGMAVWLVEKLLDVEKYSRFVYKIEGTWDDPIITNLSKADK